MNTSRQRLFSAILLAGICVPAMAMEATSDGAAAPHNFSFYNAPGADDAALASPQVLDSYLFVAGSAFHPRTSAQSVTYAGAGCISSSAAVTTDLQLPDGAAVYGVRTYYYNLGAPTSVYTSLTVYDGAGNFTDLLSEPSTLNGGYASEYFDFDPDLIVDNIPQSYVLTGNISSDAQLCGMRVFYGAP